MKNKNKNESLNKRNIFDKKLIITLILLVILMVIVSICLINRDKKVDFEQLNLDLEQNSNLKTAVFSGGCFWCVESDLEKLNGVKQAISGYTSNNSLDSQPIYEEVASGETNFRESVLVVYDSSILTYEELVTYFFTIHDASDVEGSFYDRGFQYTSAIYYETNQEKRIIQNIIKELEEKKLFQTSIITSVEELQNFYTAEKYHQDYYKENPVRYNLYRTSSGREKFVKELQEKYSDIE